MALMEQIRNSTQSGFAYILVGVLIVFFAVFFGVPADGCRASGGRVLMANVAGEDIYTEDVNVIFNRYWGGQRTVDDDQFFQQQAEALKVVITTHLLAQRAHEAGLRVSDEEFVQFIMDQNRNVEFLSTYGRGGQFDGPFYERYVQHGLRVPLQRYENFKRKELLALKYMAMLDMQINVTPQEVEELNQLRNTRVNLEFVKFSEEKLTENIGVDDEAVANFLAQNRSRVEEFYNENRADYETEEQVQIRRIYIVKPGEEMGANEAREAFETARARVDAGEDFGDVARELSEDYARDQGGLMDWNSPQNMDQTVARAIADAEVGEVREVETDFAYMLVKLEDRRPSEVTPLEDVQDDIARRLLGEEIVATRGGELAQQLHQRVAQGNSLQQALNALEAEAREAGREQDAQLWASMSVETTGFFTLEGQQIPAQLRAQFGDALGFGRAWYQLPRLGENRELAIQAFQLTSEEPLVGDVVELADARAVVRLADREDPEELTAEDRASLEMEVRAQKVNELLGPWEFFFFRPTQDIGHYIQNVFEEGINSRQVRLYERNSRAAALVRQMAQSDIVDGLLGDASQVITVD